MTIGGYLEPQKRNASAIEQRRQADDTIVSAVLSYQHRYMVKSKLHSMINRGLNEFN